VGCRESRPKDELLRLVRSAEGELRVDAEGRAEGRGAYVCSRPECTAEVAQGTGPARSFRAPVKVPHETIDSIREWQRSASTR
jgi:predicted RNA-binding protein YlxR (DUF448 family)